MDKRTAVLAVAILASSIGYIDSTALTVALPAIKEQLPTDEIQAQWVVQVYLLPLAALIAIGGAMGDRFGRRRMLEIGTWIFTLASIGCACAGNAAALIAARCVQGIGAALMIPESLALITATYADPAERGKATGIWASASAATMAAGPLLGGWLTHHYSWNWVFIINVPLGAAVLLLAYFYVPESRLATVRGRLDVLGAATLTVALVLIVVGLMAVPQHGVRPETVAALLVGLLLLAVFVRVERVAADPAVPLRLFGIPTFAVASVYTLLFYAALGGALIFVPYELERVMNFDANEAGLALLPTIGIVAFGSPFAGLLSTRFGARWFLIAGAAIAAAGYALFVLLGEHAAQAAVLPGAFVLGIGVALAAAPLTAAAMGAAGAENLGAASGISNSISRVGNLVGLAVMGIVMAADGGQALPSKAHDAGFHNAMLCAAVIALAAAMVAPFVPSTQKREPSAPRRNRDEQAEAAV